MTVLLDFLRSRLFPTAIILILAFSSVATGAQQPEQPQFRISTFTPGPVGGSIGTSDFTQELSTGDWCKIARAAQTGSWRRPGEDTPPHEWVSVLTTGFGEHADAYAFMFDADSTMTFLAHIPYGMTWVYKAKRWIPPTAKLAEEFRQKYAARSKDVKRTPVTLEIVQWGGTDATAALAEDDGLGDLFGEDAESDDGMNESAATKAIMPMRAIVHAAAFEAGWQPTKTKVATSVRVELKFGFDTCTIRTTLKRDGKTITRTKANILQERYHDNLRRIFSSLHNNENAYDFADLGSASAVALSASARGICALRGGHLIGLSSVTGKVAWPEVFPKTAPRGNPYTTRSTAASAPLVLRSSGSLSSINVDSGVSQSIAPVSPSPTDIFDIRAGNKAAIYDGEQLVFCQDGKKVWAVDCHPITAGPRIDGKKVYAGNDRGELIAFAVADGRELWRKAVGGDLRGSIIMASGNVIVFSARKESLFAANALTGEMTWERQIGDVLVEAPTLCSSGIFVAAKNNRLMIISAKSGAIRKEKAWATWLVAARVVGTGDRGIIVCSDIRGRVSFLSAKSLKLLRSVTMPEAIVGRLIYIPGMPTEWATSGSEDDLLGSISQGNVAPAILATDSSGFCHFLSLPTEGKR